MKLSIGLSFVILLATAVLTRAQAGEVCAACKAPAELTNKLAALNYAKDADKNKGDLLTIQAVQEFDKFTTRPKGADRLELFSNLVSLARVAAPFDGESQISQILSSILEKNPDLTRRYEKDLAAMPHGPARAESCKTMLLESRVKEALCLHKTGVNGQQPSRAQADEALRCTSDFNYAGCLTVQKAAP